MKRLSNLLKCDCWSQKWASFKRGIYFLKHYILWFITNFAISLFPVLITLGIDYNANVNNFNYSDAVFLGTISFSFTLLITSDYSRRVWEEEKPFIGVITIFCVLVLSTFYAHYYTLFPNFIEGKLAQIISDNKFTVVNTLLLATLFFSSYLSIPTIRQSQYNEAQKKMRKAEEKTNEDYDKLKAKLG